MRILLTILFCFVLFGCFRQWQTNEDYLDYLASIVIRYQDKHGKVPRVFEEAHEESGITLPNRGDINGGSLGYYALPPNAFMFRALGKNRKDDKGLADDLDIYYVNKAKVGRKEFITELNRDPIYRESYSDLFSK
jgi:hypothetical protein